MQQQSLHSKLIPFTKSPTTYAEQVELLKSRGVNIYDTNRAINCLSRYGYYRLEAYALNFQYDREKHLFRPGTFFEQIIGLYRFDRKLRLLLLDAIEAFEISLRTTFANYLSCAYQTPFPHLKRELFVKSKGGRDVYEESISLLKKEFERSKEVFVDHFKNTYSEILPPIWMSTELMTLGELSKWYKNLVNKKDKREIAIKYGLRCENFISFLIALTHIRNFAAHHARVWNRNMSARIDLKNLPEELNNNLNFDNNTRIYNVLVILIYCLKKIESPLNLTEKIRMLIGHYNISAAEMGFPEGWKSLSYWKWDREYRDILISVDSDTIDFYKNKFGEDWKEFFLKDLQEKYKN